MSEKELPPGRRMVISKKKVAKDGTQRGLKRAGYKTRQTVLLEQIHEHVKKVTGTEDWDPVVAMAVISEQARIGYGAVDEKGRPIIDPETGSQVMVPPDLQLAVAAAAKVAPYLHQQMRPADVEQAASQGDDPDETKQRVLSALSNMGVKVQEDDNGRKSNEQS